MNRAGLDMIEADSLDQVKGKCVYPLVAKDYREAFKAMTRDVFRGESRTLEFHMIGLKGRPLWLYTHAVPLRNENEEIVFALATTIDITERKRAEMVLKKREKQLAESQRIGHIGSWEHNLKTGEVFWSDELFRLLGLDPATDQADFRMFFEMVHPADQPMLKKAIDETLRDKKPFSIDYRFVFRDGTPRIIHAQAELLGDDAGDPVILSGTGQDITERKLAEDELKKSEQFIRSILDTVDEGFIVVDRDYRIITANKAYCDQVGGHGDEIIGRHCYEISHHTERPCYEEGEECAVRQVFETGGPYTALHRHIDAKGDNLYVETKAFPIKDSAGDVISVIETVNNITEKHLLEEERLKTQKLEAIGTLAGGIAHDFNNLLQGIFGHIFMAKMSISDRDRALAMLNQAERALHMSVNLTSQLLTFSKGGKPVMERIMLPPVIENSVKFALSGSRVDCRIDLDGDLWAVEADEGQIGQVVQNIVINADQSMPEGGTILITARNVFSPEKKLQHMPREGKYIEITVQDSGVGIPGKYLQKIFDPYFSTKEKGSGLGLSTSYSIIRNHGGVIDVASEPGSGTTFFIYLPAAAEERELKEKEKEQCLLTGRGRVLVMDDEDIVRTVAGHMIGSLGYEADFAENGEKAIEKYAAAMKKGKPFDAVILDLTVRGGMGGREVIETLAELDHEVKAIVSSGYSEDVILANYEEYGFKALLSKPYEIAELGRVLHSLLQAEDHVYGGYPDK